MEQKSDPNVSGSTIVIVHYNPDEEPSPRMTSNADSDKETSFSQRTSESSRELAAFTLDDLAVPSTSKQTLPHPRPKSAQEGYDRIYVIPDIPRVKLKPRVHSYHSPTEHERLREEPFTDPCFPEHQRRRDPYSARDSVRGREESSSGPLQNERTGEALTNQEYYSNIRLLCRNCCRRIRLEREYIGLIYVMVCFPLSVVLIFIFTKHPDDK